MNEIISQGYAPIYQKRLHNQLSILLNFAVKYYGLTENPGRKAGSMGKLEAESFYFWTHEEFKQFIMNKSWPDINAAINILYWTGI
ncbi:hypothetical protein [Clostridium sp. KNHs205]|uniref:hypothetical protein n=1 Tax=Clostridium sp. KNHs205 TaxID=1449050 RepID=UPI00051B680B|nr:hypothetical protein [Clostridium sp. KNHs205]